MHQVRQVRRVVAIMKEWEQLTLFPDERIGQGLDPWNRPLQLDLDKLAERVAEDLRLLAKLGDVRGAAFDELRSEAQRQGIRHDWRYVKAKHQGREAR